MAGPARRTTGPVASELSKDRSVDIDRAGLLAFVRAMARQRCVQLDSRLQIWSSSAVLTTKKFQPAEVSGALA